MTMNAFLLIAQQVAPQQSGGLQVPQIPTSTLIVAGLGIAIIGFLYFSSRDVGNRRHQPGRRRRSGEGVHPDCNCGQCPPRKSPVCLPAEVSEPSRKLVGVYIPDVDCCGDGGLTRADLQAIADHDQELIEAERREQLATRMQSLFGQPPTSKK